MPSATYILTNQNHTVLYVGVTSDLVRRVSAHKMKISRGFTARYNVDHLVYFEAFEDIGAAISRETELKKKSRRGKVLLIERMNPTWRDLSSNLW